MALTSVQSVSAIGRAHADKACVAGTAADGCQQQLQREVRGWREADEVMAVSLVPVLREEVAATSRRRSNRFRQRMLVRRSPRVHLAWMREDNRHRDEIRVSFGLG